MFPEISALKNFLDENPTQEWFYNILYYENTVVWVHINGSQILYWSKLTLLTIIIKIIHLDCLVTQWSNLSNVCSNVLITMKIHKEIKNLPPHPHPTPPPEYNKTKEWVVEYKWSRLPRWKFSHLKLIFLFILQLVTIKGQSKKTALKLVTAT